MTTHDDLTGSDTTHDLARTTCTASTVTLPVLVPLPKPVCHGNIFFSFSYRLLFTLLVTRILAFPASLSFVLILMYLKTVRWELAIKRAPTLFRSFAWIRLPLPRPAALTWSNSTFVVPDLKMKLSFSTTVTGLEDQVPSASSPYADHAKHLRCSPTKYYILNLYLSTFINAAEIIFGGHVSSEYRLKIQAQTREL